MLYLGDFMLWCRATTGRWWPLANASCCSPGGFGAKFGLPKPMAGFCCCARCVGGVGVDVGEILLPPAPPTPLPALAPPPLPLPPPNSVDLFGAKLRRPVPVAVVVVVVVRFEFVAAAVVVALVVVVFVMELFTKLLPNEILWTCVCVCVWVCTCVCV